MKKALFLSVLALFVLSITVPFTDEAFAQDSEPWRYEANGHYYKVFFVANPLLRPEAATKAAYSSFHGVQGVLATIPDVYVQIYINARRLELPPDQNTLWFGLHRLSHESPWFYDSGEPLSFQFWYGNEGEGAPDNIDEWYAMMCDWDEDHSGRWGSFGNGVEVRSNAYAVEYPDPPPAADAGQDQSVIEGTLVTLDGGSSSDPDDDYPLTFFWEISTKPDGSTVELNNPDSITPSFMPDMPGTYVITLVVDDSYGVSSDPDQAIVEALPNQSPVADAGGPYISNEGSAITFDASASYDDDGDLLEYRWDFDSDGSWDTEWSTFPTALYAWCDDWVGIASVEVSDGKETSFATANVTVSNVAPLANAGEDKSGDEPSTFTFAGSHTDTGIEDTHTYEWDFDYDYVTFDVDATGNGVTKSWPDDFNGVVALRVTDDDGGYDIDTCSVMVNNVAPAIGDINAPTDPIRVGAELNAVASFTDPGIQDTWTAIWDWGDGIETTIELSDIGTISATHTYTQPDVYTVTLTITDDDGGSHTRTYEYIVVYNAAGGFVTGGGWFNSPTGAYTPHDLSDPDLTGKATFGFISKYKKGTTVPIGNTEFQFKAGDLNFHSDTYQWLVVNQNGTNAQFKGSGTVNGSGEYKFMIWASDGEIDTFRIKIWEEDGEGNETVLYDNGSNQPIEGGSIIIHTGN